MMKNDSPRMGLKPLISVRLKVLPVMAAPLRAMT
jgi:hypothetical protein